MKKILYGIIGGIIVLFLARYRFAQPLFAQYLMRQAETAVNRQYGDYGIRGARIENNIFTLVGKDYHRIIYARFVCHFRCAQTDLYVEDGGKGSFIQKTTEDTSRLESAGKP